ELDGDACDDVVATVSNGVDTSVNGAATPRCALDTGEVTVEVNGQSRPCVGGRMGALLQEREKFVLQRLQVLGQLRSLVSQLEPVYTLIDKMSESLDL